MGHIDPAGGRAIRMAVRDGQLVSADANSNGSRGRPYRFDGNAVTFGGGTPIRPGNQAHNIGSFSVQGNKARQAGGDPRRADEIQLRELASVTPPYERAARAAGLDPNNALLLASYYDMQTQSPATASAFLRELPNLARQGVTVENITDARVRAFHNNGKTGGWHASSQQHRVRPDAERRMNALVSALRAQGLAQ